MSDVEDSDDDRKAAHFARVIESSNTVLIARLFNDCFDHTHREENRELELLSTKSMNLGRIGLHETKKDVTIIRVMSEQLATDRSCHLHESKRDANQTSVR